MESALKKIPTSIGQTFTTKLQIERECRKSKMNRALDPRSSSRSPGANGEPNVGMR